MMRTCVTSLMLMALMVISVTALAAVQFDEYALRESPILNALKGRDIRLCDQNSQLWAALQKTNFYYRGIYRLTGDDAAVFEVVLQDLNGINFVANGSDGFPLKIFQTGRGNFPQGLGVNISLLQICQAFPEKTFSAEEMIAYLSGLKIDSRPYRGQ